MKNIFNLMLAMFFFSVTTSATPGYLKFGLFLKKPDKTFHVSSKSRIVELKKGQTYHVKMKLRKNRYYFISVKGKKFLGPVQCRIIVPSEDNKVIFDNAAYGFDNDILFYNDEDRDVKVEIRTMPCCYENVLQKKGNVRLVFANKKLKRNETFDVLDTDYTLFAVK